jgi:methylated-DNA-[protein]-cysteine S-methyltransferase
MRSANPAYIATKIQIADDFYYPVLCRCKFLEFQMIISKSAITHLSFSREGHHQAIKKISRFMPKAELSSPNNEIVQAKKLVLRIFGAGQERPAPSFKHNPFLRSGTQFQQKIWRLISYIKPGETTTYGELATAAGSPGGARAVGRACNQNPLALVIPCHRVVAANGPGGFAGDLAIKLKLLEIEKNSSDTQGVRLSDIKCSIIDG